MNTSTTLDSIPLLWSEESSNRADRKRIRARIGGLHCSLCTGTFRRQRLLTNATPFIVGGLAVIMVFGIASHILHMAFQSVRRGILNQHVLLEAGAFAGLSGGIIDLIFRPPGYPTTPFFAVAVLVVTYHIFSEWLSLIVKTRSSQAVKRLLDLQPDTVIFLNSLWGRPSLFFDAILSVGQPIQAEVHKGT